jgi:hypothetical protein
MDEQDIQEQQRLLRQAMQELQEGSTVTADTFFRLNKETSKLGKSLEAAEEAIDRFWRSPVGKATKAVGDLASGIARGAQAARSNRESFESLNPVIDGAAAALSAIPLVGDALGKTLSTVGTFVTAELQKSVEAFQTLGSVGAVGASGVTGLRKSAEQAGLAFDQLAKITQTNAKGLALSTGSTAEGARAITQITRAARPFQSQLLALGVGITEQSEYFAEYLNLNRRLNRNQISDYRSLASSSADYVKQINLLSRLTGESADAMKAELEAQMSNVQFRAALQLIPQDLRAGAQNIVSVIGSINKDMGTGLQDIFGGSLGTKAAQDVFKATGGAAKDIIDQYKARLITQEEALARIRDAAALQRERVGDQFVSVAGNMAHGLTDTLLGTYDLADATNLLRDNLVKTSAEALATAKAQDPATKGMIDAQQSLQRFATEADKFVNDQIFPRATEVVGSLTDGLAKLVGGINLLVSGGTSYEEDNPFNAWLDETYFEGRAMGGPVTGGRPYVVGEQGIPELFLPEKDGQILTAEQANALFEMLAKTKIASHLSDSSMSSGEAFLPGIGYLTKAIFAGGEVGQLSGLDGNHMFDYTKYASNNNRMNQVRSGDQTYRRMHSYHGDLKAQSGWAAMSGPAAYYDRMMSQVAPLEGAGVTRDILDDDKLVGRENVQVDPAVMVEMQKQMLLYMQDIAQSSKKGADNGAKLLRASTQ